MTQTKATATGLDGVCVAETLLSDVQGDAGRLIVAGEDIEILGKNSSFEGVTTRLWRAAEIDPDLTEATLKTQLALARKRAFTTLHTPALALENGMDSLRAQLVMSPASTPLDLLAVSGTALGSWYRGRPVEPDAGLGHAADVLRMMTGETEPGKVRAFERYLVTVAEHGMNASTFTARVVTSTGADAKSAVVAAIGALKGPLHGGAPGPVLDMLDAVGSAENAEAWLEKEIASGRRIMGMGHRIYRTRDPRAAVLEAALAELPNAGHRLPLARAVERAARTALKRKYPERSLDTNVEFYTAVLLDAVGIDRRAFSAIFALARTAGWLAHVHEQTRVGRLIRPDSKYVGA